MGEVVTSRLALVAPNPGTSEPVDISDHLVSNWGKIDGAIGAFPCTEATKPGSPFDGMIIRTTDTRRMYVWNATNTSWDQVMAQGGTFSLPATGSTAAIRSYLSSGTAAGNRMLAGRGSTDTNDTFFIDHDGAMQWGPGSGASDTSLSRVSTGKLRMTGQFQAGTCVPVEVALATSDTSTSTTYVAATQHGVAFVAPPSGAVWIYLDGALGTATTSATDGSYLGFEIRQGSTVGSGTSVQAAGDGDAAFYRPSTTSGFKYATVGVRRRITGLTSGNSYNVRTMIRTTSASHSAAIQQRYLCVEPIYSL